MNDLVSVIVPVYNVERYIEKCIESIVNQTYKNIEIIIIDDESIDNSKNIIENYMRLDKRIKYLCQKNSGPSVSRNKGILEANGEFIIFVDSDDWIDHDMIENMINEIKRSKCDLVLCDFILEKDSQSIYNKILPEKGDIAVVDIKKQLVNSDTLNSLWNKIYKRNIILNNNLLFDKKLRVGEDQVFNMQYINHVNRVSYIEKGFYHYRMVSDSTCRRVHENQVKMLEYQQKIRNSIINDWKDDIDEYKIESAKWFLQNIASYCYLASIKSCKKEEVLTSLINSETTIESLNFISNNKVIYEINLHKILVPLIKSNNKFLIICTSKIYYMLSYLKNKLG